MRLLVSVLVAVAGAVVAPDIGRPVPHAEAGQATAAALALADAQSDRLSRLYVDFKERVRTDGVPPTPYHVVDPVGGERSLVLPPRDSPYLLTEIRAGFPETLVAVEPGVWLLTEHIFVVSGARLEIAAGALRELRLRSTANGFVAIAMREGELRFTGDDAGRLVVRSWDPASGAVDANVEDGRAFVLALGGRMEVERVEFSDLGFALGKTSGVAWKGTPEAPSRGDVADSRFRRNFFGAYTFEAVEMRWVGNVFADNAIHGFDAHDYSDRFLVERNVASGNGRHGIIFSRGCADNVVRFNLSFGNGGHGIVLDDGASVGGDGLSGAGLDPSNGNRIAFNAVWGNQVGIALEGGTGNVLRGNYAGGNRHGLRLKDAAGGNEIVGNMLVDNEVSGIFGDAGSGDNWIAGNRIAGGGVGITIEAASGNRIVDNTIGGIEGHAVVLTGETGGTEIVGNVLGGRGSEAIDADGAVGVDAATFAGNDLTDWDAGRSDVPVVTATVDLIADHPALLPWLAIFLLPVLHSLRRRTSAAGRLLAGAASPGSAPSRTEGHR